MDCILSDRSWQSNFDLCVDRTCTISHVFFLSGLHHIPTLSERSWQFSFNFDVDHTFMISHIIILSGLHDKPHPLRLTIKVQFHFWCKTDLCDGSCRCAVSSSFYTTYCPIDLDTQVSYFMEIKPVLSITSLSCLLFVIDHILSHWSWQFSFDFGVGHNYMISDVIALSSIHHRPYYIGSIMTVQFHFRCKVDMYN